MVEVIQRHLSQIKAIDGETSSAMVMEIGWLFIMGKRALNVKDLVSKHYKEIKSAFMAIPLNIPGLALNKGIKAREKIADIINHILNTDPFAKSDPNCCLGGIAEAHGHDGIEVEIRILALLFAATETTIGVTNGILWHLIENPTVLNKLQKEIRETPEPKTLTDFHNFPYLNKVIHEGLRLYGVDVVIRESKEGLKYNNIYFPAGTYFAVAMGYEHHSVYDPKHFNPDREENYKWEPFGTPARSCIGRAFAFLEMKMILYQTLKNYNVTGEKLENASIRQGLNVKLFNARLKLEPVSETIS